MGGGGVDGAIHRNGGPAILEECKKIRSEQGECPTGEAVITSGGKLKAEYVIHTVGPVWYDGSKGEDNLLRNAYLSSLKLASEKKCRSVAFPNISTGLYRFPKDRACKIALESINEFLDNSVLPKKILFVCLDEENFRLYTNFMRR